MFIDGEVCAVSSLPQLNASDSSFNPRDTLIRTFKPGECIGEESFDPDMQDYKFPFNMVCRKRCMTLNLKRKDFAEVLQFQKQQKQTNWQKFLLEIPFMKAMPYHLRQDVCGTLN